MSNSGPHILARAEIGCFSWASEQALSPGLTEGMTEVNVGSLEGAVRPQDAGMEDSGLVEVADVQEDTVMPAGQLH